MFLILFLISDYLIPFLLFYCKFYFNKNNIQSIIIKILKLLSYFDPIFKSIIYIINIYNLINKFLLFYNKLNIVESNVESEDLNKEKLSKCDSTEHFNNTIKLDPSNPELYPSLDEVYQKQIDIDTLDESYWRSKAFKQSWCKMDYEEFKKVIENVIFSNDVYIEDQDKLNSFVLLISILKECIDEDHINCEKHLLMLVTYIKEWQKTAKININKNKDSLEDQEDEEIEQESFE
jgi:hypothetical protein